MYNVSEVFLQKIKLNNRSISGKLYLGDLELTDEDIISMDMEYSLGNDNIPAIGGVVASRIDIRVSRNKLPTVLTTQELKPYLGLETSPGTIEYIPMGVFRINPKDTIKTDKTITLVGYDILYILEDSPYNSNLTFPVTWSQIKTELETKGLKFKVQSLANVTIKEKPNTIRELLSDIAELLGMNVVSNRLGEIEFRGLTTTTFEFDNHKSFKLLADDEVKLTRLTVEKEEEENNLTYGNDTGFTIKIKNDSITTENELITVYNRVMPISYTAYECEVKGYPHLDVGDIVKIIDRFGVERNVPIAYHKIRYSGGLSSEIRANAPQGAISSTGSTGSRSITQSLNDLRVNILEVNHILADKADINLVVANEARINDLYAVKATVSDLQATNARIATLEVGYADISVLEADLAEINTLLAGNLDATNLKAGLITATSGLIANLAITNAMIANMDVSKLNAGDISTSKFRVKSDSGNLRIQDNTIQIADSIRTRVQIGKDASNDYNMYVWDANGKLMFDATGLHADGIKNPIIRDDMVSPTANISGDKLNIGSVVQSINNGVTKLESSSVLYNGKTLNVAFNEFQTNLNSTVDKTVKSTDVEYYLSTSPTSLSGGTWQATAPTWVNGKYMWSRTKVTLSDGTTKYTPSINGTCIAGAKGDKGEDGKGVVSAAITYQLHTNGTTAPTGTWSTSIPSPIKGRYLWTRTTTKYTDNSEVTTYSVSYLPTDGQNGNDGKGILSTVVTYQLHTSGTAVPTGTWSSGIPTIIKGMYLWTRTIITYTDNSTSTSYSTSYYPTDGQKGETGKGITSITPEYYLSTSKTTQTGGSWTTTPPTWVSGKYIWTRNKIVYNNPTSTEYTTPVVDTSLDNIQADIETRVKTTDFEIEQGKIATLISDVSTVQGEVNSTKSRVSTVEQTVGSISTKVSNLETDNNTTKSNLSTLTQDVNSFKTTVSETYTTKAETEKLKKDMINLVPNPSVSGSLDGWSSAATIESVEFYGKAIPTMKVVDATVAAGGKTIYSPYFDVDPSKAYEVSAWFKSTVPPNNAGSTYLGLNANPNVVEPINANGTLSSDSSNFYFWGTSDTGSLGEWTKITGFIVPVGFDPSKMKNIGTSRNARMKADCKQIRLRWLNFYNYGTERTVWVAHPSVREVPVELITTIADKAGYTDVTKTVNTAKSEIKQYADQVGINVTNTVANTYETKTGVDSKINTAKGEIKVTTDAIESRVSNVESTMNTVTPHHIILTNENQSILTDSTGKVTVATTVTTDIDTFKGVNRIAGTIGTPILKNSAGTTISFGTITKSNPTASASGKVTWTIPINTNISSDSGWIEIPITIEGKSYVKKLTWNKAKEGAKGDKGETGSQGIQGPKGADGTTYYTWIKYADTPTTGMSDSPTGKTYMGIAYNKTSPTKSTNYGDYSWSLIKGTDGIQGPKGADGQTLYTWIKYADNASGGGMSDSPTGKLYIGIAHNKTTATESTIASDYTWSLIKGDKGNTGAKGADGAPAKLVDIVPSQIYFVKKQTSITPNIITLTPNFQNCIYSKWEYSTNGTTWSAITQTTSSTTVPWMNSSTRVLTIPKAWSILNNNSYVIFRVTTTTGESDVQTISILYDVTELETRVNSAEQKITPTAIMQTVEQQVSAGGTTIAQKSDITQTMDAWTAKFDYLKTPIPFRYIRSSIKNEHGMAPWTEIEVYANGVNIAIGKTVTASKTPASGELSLYTNGDNNLAGTTTYVLLNGLGTSYGWLKVDLGSIVENVETIIDYIPFAAEYDYKLEVSKDNINWTPIFVGKSSSKINSFGLSGFEQGIIKMNGAGVKVEHSLDNQSSELRADGFVRTGINGETYYVSGIDIVTGSTTSMYSEKPAKVTVPLPIKFKNRNVKCFPVMISHRTYLQTRLDTANNTAIGYLTTFLEASNINKNTPSVDVEAWARVDAPGGIDRYGGVTFALLILSQ